MFHLYYCFYKACTASWKLQLFQRCLLHTGDVICREHAAKMLQSSCCYCRVHAAHAATAAAMKPYTVCCRVHTAKLKCCRVHAANAATADCRVNKYCSCCYCCCYSAYTAYTTISATWIKNNSYLLPVDRLLLEAGKNFKADHQINFVPASLYHAWVLNDNNIIAKKPVWGKERIYLSQVPIYPTMYVCKNFLANEAILFLAGICMQSLCWWCNIYYIRYLFTKSMR